MCRNIRILFNFDPPVTDEEVRAASLQFVRKISGFNKPSKANEASFQAAVEEIAAISLVFSAHSKPTLPKESRRRNSQSESPRRREVRNLSLLRLRTNHGPR